MDVDPFTLDYFACLHKSFARIKGGAKTRTMKVRARVQQSITRFQSLGFKKTHLEERLKHAKDKDLEEFSIDEIIVGFANAWRHHAGNMGQTIAESGLNKSTAEELSAILRPLQNTCYTDDQLYNIGIGYLLSYYKPVRGPKAKFLYQSPTIGTWFTVTNHPYNIINIMSRCKADVTPIIHAKTHTRYNAENGSLYYHATSWSYAQSIMEYIDFTRGSRCQDFGRTPGFYLSETMENALDWGEKKGRLFKNEVAIVIFHIPSNLSKIQHYRVLDGELWVKVVKESRRCISANELAEMPCISANELAEMPCISANELAEIRDSDFLYGSMLANPSAVRDGVEEPRPHTNPKKQLVSRSRKSDAFLQSAILGCVFFQKYIGGDST